MTEIYDVAFSYSEDDAHKIHPLTMTITIYSYKICVTANMTRIHDSVVQNDIGMIEVFAPSGSCITARVFGRSDAIASIENLQLALRYCEGV